MRRPALFGCVLLLAGCASSGATSNQTGDATPPSAVTIDMPTTVAGEGGVAHGFDTGVYASSRESNITSVPLLAAPDQLWPALRQLFAELELPVTSMDSTAHLLVTNGVRLRQIGKQPVARFFECPATGYGNSARGADLFVTVQARLLPVPPDATEMRLQLASFVRLATKNDVICRSTGALEKRFRDALTAASTRVGS